MTFTPLGIPKAEPSACIENSIAILSQLQMKLRANLIGFAFIAFLSYFQNKTMLQSLLLKKLLEKFAQELVVFNTYKAPKMRYF